METAREGRLRDVCVSRILFLPCRASRIERIAGVEYIDTSARRLRTRSHLRAKSVYLLYILLFPSYIFVHVTYALRTRFVDLVSHVERKIARAISF